VLPLILGSSGNFEVIVFGLLMLLVLQRFPQGVWPTLAMAFGRFVKPARPRTERSASPLEQRTMPPAGQVLLDARDVTKRFGGLVANNRSEEHTSELQ